MNGRCVTTCSPETDVGFCQRLGKNCGPVTGNDNCGIQRTAMCGQCTTPQTCQADSVCRCVPETDAQFCVRLGKNCGLLAATDSCGLPRTATCGTCTAPQSCGGSGVTNVCGCTPACAGKRCGADGCGGTCGACPANSTCDSDQSGCSCNAGFFSDSTRSTCQPLNVACPATEPAEYCLNNRYWVLCDPQWGRQFIDCGDNQCQLNGRGPGRGSCTCGLTNSTYPSLNSAGVCLQPSFSSINREYWFSCTPGNRTYVDNCRAVTGLPTGRCWTYVTSFGTQSGCYCDTCLDYNYSTSQCVPACSFGSCSAFPVPGTFLCQ